MRMMLLGAAAAIAATALAPAAAQARNVRAGPAVGADAGAIGSAWSGGSHWRDGDWRDDDWRWRGRRGPGRGTDTIILGPVGWDSNRSFDADRWNDWWHERPDRAYPAWVRNNQNCERVWWSGGGWRC